MMFPGLSQPLLQLFMITESGCVTLCRQVIDLVDIFISLRTCELRVGLRHSSYHHLISIFLHFRPPVTTVKLAYLHIVQSSIHCTELLQCPVSSVCGVVGLSAAVPCRLQATEREKPNIGGSFYNTVAD